MSTVSAFLDMAIDGLSDLTRADVVAGKPVEIRGKKLIPILALNVGFGGGGGQGEGEGVQPQSGGKHRGGKGKGKGAGTGAGGGAKLVPIALIVQDEKGVRVLKVPQKKRGIEKLFDKIPSFVEKIQEKIDSSKLH